MADKKIIVLSLGGSLIAPPAGVGRVFLKKFQRFILAYLKKGYRFAVVCGGGYPARVYQAALKQISPAPTRVADEVGIYATWLNAALLRAIFVRYAHDAVITNPTAKINWRRPLLFAGGWRPGCSTDYDAVLLAENLGASSVINLTNIDYVYDKDPRRHADARRLANISWPELRKIVGNKWVPGANVPFDPVAAKRAQKLKLKVYFVKGAAFNELAKAVAGRKFKGTVIG